MQVQVGQRIRKRYTESRPVAVPDAAFAESHYMTTTISGISMSSGASQAEIPVRPKRPTGQKITIRPLVGTARAAPRRWRDKAIETELVNDPKERAEHVMLIDLARNDIGPHREDRHACGDRGLCGGALQPRDAHRQQRRGSAGTTA